MAQEEQRQHLREQQVESSSSSHVLQRSLKIQRKRPNYRVVSPTRAKSRTPRPLPKAFSIWASFFFKQTQVKLHDLFLHLLRAVRISKKIPSLTLTQLDAESIICLFGQIIDSRCRDKNRAAFRDSILDDGRGMRPITMIIEKTCRSVTRPLLGRVRSIVISKLTVFSAPAGWKYRKFYRVLRYKLDLPWSLR